jgi:hypothetical protein
VGGEERWDDDVAVAVEGGEEGGLRGVRWRREGGGFGCGWCGHSDLG